MFETLTPEREMGRLLEELDRLIDSGAARARIFAHRIGLRPALDLYDTGTELILRAVVPGAKPEDLDVSIEQSAVALRGRYGATLGEEEAKRVTWYRREIVPAQFAEVIPLPAPVDAEQAAATFQDGILTLILPKVPQARSRRIRITSETRPAG